MFGLELQLKQERALQEQASTYLQLICSTCDLTEEKVQETAADIQQVKIQVAFLTLPLTLLQCLLFKHKYINSRGTFSSINAL